MCNLNKARSQSVLVLRTTVHENIKKCFERHYGRKATAVMSSSLIISTDLTKVFVLAKAEIGQMY